MLLAYRRIRDDGTLQHSRFLGDTQQEKEQTLLIRNLALQSILILQHYPEIVEEMQPQSIQKPQKGFAISKEVIPSNFQLPRWLGQDRKISQKYEGYVGTGTGSKKRIHHRSGHWRNLEPAEEGGEERITWVKPAWVNKPK